MNFLPSNVEKRTRARCSTPEQSLHAAVSKRLLGIAVGEDDRVRSVVLVDERGRSLQPRGIEEKSIASAVRMPDPSVYASMPQHQLGDCINDAARAENGTRRAGHTFVYLRLGLVQITE